MQFSMDSQYQQLIQLMLMALTKRLLKFYSGEFCNESGFKETFNKIAQGIKSLEEMYDMWDLVIL